MTQHIVDGPGPARLPDDTPSGASTPGRAGSIQVGDVSAPGGQAVGVNRERMTQIRDGSS
jgi:hypothetical protein